MNRRKTGARQFFTILPVTLLLGCALLPAVVPPAQEPGPSRPNRNPAAEPPRFPLDDEYIRATLPPGDEKYARITGAHIKSLLKEATAISLRYRDEGHQYWGRLTGLPSDSAADDWIVAHFKRIGLANVRLQNFDLPAQWVPQSFHASVSAGGKSVRLKSVFPTFGSAGTPAAGLDLEPVWVGLGTPSDYAGREVKGKAALIYSIPTPGGRNHSAQWNGAIERAEKSGAAAVVLVMGFPGNVMSQPGGEGGPGGTSSPVPHVNLGAEDGSIVREMIEQGLSPRLHLSLDIKQVPGLKTANVWAELPGTGGENIVIMSHSDGYFQGALDNASGMAGMLAIAEYFAKVPQERRPRTLIFLVTTGHHAGGPGIRWVHENRGTVLAKTALILNCEHFAQTQTYWLGAALMPSNTVSARRWFVSGSETLKQLAARIFRDFGVALYSRPEIRPGGELSQVYGDAPGVHIIDHIYYHTDMDIPELVPEAGLENSVRAYAKIVDAVNELPINALRALTPTR